MIGNYYPSKPTVTGLDTVEQALAALEAAVATRGGDYVYPRAYGTCFYVELEPKLEPSCLIGLVLHRAGVPLEWFIAPAPGGATRNSLGAVELVDTLGLTPEVGGILCAAQEAQDRGSSWAVALQAAYDAAITNLAIDEVVAA